VQDAQLRHAEVEPQPGWQRRSAQALEIGFVEIEERVEAGPGRYCGPTKYFGHTE
jgi:hypothetical protein